MGLNPKFLYWFEASSPSGCLEPAEVAARASRRKFSRTVCSAADASSPFGETPSFSWTIPRMCEFQDDGGIGLLVRSLRCPFATSRAPSTSASLSKTNVTSAIKWWLKGETTPLLAMRSWTILSQKSNTAFEDM